MQVGSGPVAISARPHAVSLAASHFEGPGLSRCVAGERAEFLIQVALATHASAACPLRPSELVAVSDPGRQRRLMHITVMQAKDAQGHLVTKSDTPFAVRVCCGDEEVAGVQQGLCYTRAPKLILVNTGNTNRTGISHRTVTISSKYRDMGSRIV